MLTFAFVGGVYLGCYSGHRGEVENRRSLFNAAYARMTDVSYNYNYSTALKEKHAQEASRERCMRRWWEPLHAHSEIWWCDSVQKVWMWGGRLRIAGSGQRKANSRLPQTDNHHQHRPLPQGILLLSVKRPRS